MYLTKVIIMLVTSGLFWIRVMILIDVRGQYGHVLRDVQMAHITLDSVMTEDMRINIALRQNCTCICCLFHMNVPCFLSSFLTDRKKAFTKSITVGRKEGIYQINNCRSHT